MAQRDLHNNVKSTIGLTTRTISSSTTTTGSIIDTQGYESVEIFVIAGAITDGTYVPAVYESDDSGLASPSATPAQFLIGTTNVTGDAPSFGSPVSDPLGDATFTSADANKVARFGVLNKGRYIRPQLTSTSVTSGGTFTILVVMSHALEASTPKDK